MEIRTAVAEDVPGLQAIYDPHTLGSHSTFHTEPVPPEVWHGRLASAHPGDHVLVAVEDARVLGAAWSTEYRSKSGYAATRETSVYLADGAGGRGLGRALYDELLGRLTAAGMHTAVAGVALPNDASVALHTACGYEAVGTFREVGQKLGRWIDVRWFQKMLD
jgi:phosphinothricin acetyltransferase